MNMVKFGTGAIAVSAMAVASSVLFVELERLKEKPRVKKAGVQDIVLKGKAATKYLEVAHGGIRKELAKRSKFADQLSPLLYKPGKPNRQIDFGDTRLQQ